MALKMVLLDLYQSHVKKTDLFHLCHNEQRVSIIKLVPKN